MGQDTEAPQRLSDAEVEILDAEAQEIMENAATGEFERLKAKLRGIPETRRCKDCGADKPLTEFYRAHGLYYQPRCKPCHHVRTKNWYDKNPEARRKTDRKTRIKRVYGLTLDQYDKMLSTQQGLCAICKRPAGMFKCRLAVDHCHTTGKIRALLCTHCNTALGKFQDSPEILRTAALYVENHKS